MGLRESKLNKIVENYPLENQEKISTLKPEEKKENIKKPIERSGPIFTTSLFEGKYISDFICQICKNIPNPHKCYEIGCCGYLFCDSCILNWLEEKNTCPICKKEIENKEKNVRKIEEKSKMIYRMLLKLNLKCPYKCEWSGSFAEIDNHFKNCPLKEFDCKYKKVGCEFKGLKNECEEHEKNNVSIHLKMALDFIEKNMIKTQKKKIQFDQGSVCKVSCHEHPLTYTRGDPWYCKGSNLNGGCCSGDFHFQTPFRFRCNVCDFNLCNMCMIKYAID